MDFPESIYIDIEGRRYLYKKMYEHDKGGCYYRTTEHDDPLTSSFISLYSDGHLTFLWNGIEKDWAQSWTPSGNPCTVEDMPRDDFIEYLII